MPRSFLITKLQKWKDDEFAEDGMMSASDDGDDERIVGVGTRRRVDDDDNDPLTTTHVHRLTTQLQHAAADIASATADDDNLSHDFVGTLTKKNI